MYRLVFRHIPIQGACSDVVIEDFLVYADAVEAALKSKLGHSTYHMPCIDHPSGARQRVIVRNP